MYPPCHETMLYTYRVAVEAVTRHKVLHSHTFHIFSPKFHFHPHILKTWPTFIISDEWEKDDLDTLFEKIGKLLPKDDNVKYQTQAEKIDWVAVAFGGYSGQECHDKWTEITTKVKYLIFLNTKLTIFFILTTLSYGTLYSH